MAVGRPGPGPDLRCGPVSGAARMGAVASRNKGVDIKLGGEAVSVCLHRSPA